MATVLLARYRGPMGFWRPVAIKRLHESLARDPAFVSMLLDEARLGSRVHHPLVAEVIDLLAEDSEVSLVMQYVHGAALRALVDIDSPPVPVSIAAAVMCDALNGLHAAHEARDAGGALLGIVHRDVSPHNLLVGADGFTRVTDFGIAKAIWRVQSTSDGQLKGKLAYMAPEQLARGTLDRRADIFGASVVLWELLAGKRLFDPTGPDALLARSSWTPPRVDRNEVPSELEEVVIRGLAPDPDKRFDTAFEMAQALEHACRPAPRAEVASWVRRLARTDLARRASQLDAGDCDLSVSGSSGAWKVAPDSATLPNASSTADRTPSGLGPVASDHVRARPVTSRRAALVAAVAAGLAVFAMVSFARLRSSGAGSEPSPPDSSAAAHVQKSPSVNTPASAASLSSASPAPVTSSPERQPRPAPAKASRPARPAASAPPSCNPPYRTDDAGVKVYKVECL